LKSRPSAAFHSLSDSDKENIRQLLSQGFNLRQVALRVGCNYSHAWAFAHAAELIDYRPHGRNDRLISQAIALIRAGTPVYAAATRLGLADPVVRKHAEKQGLVAPVSQLQRRINNTNERVIYLRLRLAGVSKSSAASATGIDYRKASYLERGLENGGRMPRRSFVPAGPASRAYNKLMNRLLQANGAIEPARRPEPQLLPGVNPYQRISPRYLSHQERVAIADLRREGHSIREIARRIDRSHSSISRELRRNHSAQGPYRPEAAQLKATARRSRPQLGKLMVSPRLREYVVEGLRAQWSPEEIAGRIRHDYPDDQEMRVSHETIYEAFYLEPKGRLKDLGLTLPTGRIRRRKRTSPREDTASNRFVDKMILIDERPEEVNERVIPGHWEGDLILGARNKSAVITLVERVSRFVVLGHLPGRHDSTSVLHSLTKVVQNLDTSVWSSITWDQGSEMADHKAFSMATDIPIYFAHPASPWERGSNENTNGRLRRNLPKSSDLSQYSAHDLEMIANIHNHKPRKVLGWKTPAEVMAQALRETGSIT